MSAFSAWWCIQFRCSAVVSCVVVCMTVSCAVCRCFWVHAIRISRVTARPSGSEHAQQGAEGGVWGAGSASTSRPRASAFDWTALPSVCSIPMPLICSCLITPSDAVAGRYHSAARQRQCGRAGRLGTSRGLKKKRAQTLHSPQGTDTHAALIPLPSP